MKNILRKSDISGNVTKNEFSNNFIFNQNIKKIEIEKINPIRSKTGKKGLNDNVTISKNKY